MISSGMMSDIGDSIGCQLRTAREATGLTLDDVVFQTQLPRKILQALEDENFSVFSSPLYAKSFLLQYSGFLGVEADFWTDAIEPGDFALVSGIGCILEPPQGGDNDQATPARKARGGWLSVFGLLAVSVGVVGVAIKGYEVFENRFGRESRVRVDPFSESPVTPIPPKDSDSASSKITAGEKEEEVLTQSAPRAIIVR
jgi:cytoskeletal protein RodZ